MKIVLTQPNYAWFDKRVWEIPPYTLALLNACLKKEHDVQLFNPNYNNMSEEEVFHFSRKHSQKSSVSVQFQLSISKPPNL